MHRIRLHFPMRQSTEARVPNFTVSYDDLSMTVDLNQLPGQLKRMLPDGALAHVPAIDWHPFCVKAISMGLMR